MFLQEESLNGVLSTRQQVELVALLLQQCSSIILVYFFADGFESKTICHERSRKPTLISISQLVTSPLITTSFPGFSPNRPCWKRGSTYHFILSKSDRLSAVWFIHFHIDHNAPCIPPQRNLRNYCLRCFLGRLSYPGETGNNGYTKFWVKRGALWSMWKWWISISLHIIAYMKRDALRFRFLTNRLLDQRGGRRNCEIFGPKSYFWFHGW